MATANRKALSAHRGVIAAGTPGSALIAAGHGIPYATDSWS